MNQKPFYPTGMPAPPLAQEAVADYTTPAAPCGPGHLWCVLCRKVLDQGAPCIEIFVGKVGRGTKSGQAMAVPDEELEFNHPNSNNPVLCWDCGIPWLDEEFYGGDYYQPGMDGHFDDVIEDEDDQR